MTLITGSQFNDDVRVGGGGTPTSNKGLALASTNDADTINVGNGNDVVFAGGGDDTVSGGNGKDRLFGEDGNDILSGGNGKDWLDGGAGVDRMTGGRGSDTFVFNLATDSAVGFADTITDFKSNNDKLDFSAIDTDAGIAGDQAFTWGDTTAGGAHSIWYVTAGGNSTVYADSTGDGVADMEIILHGVSSLSASDILL